VVERGGEAVVRLLHFLHLVAELRLQAPSLLLKGLPHVELADDGLAVERPEVGGVFDDGFAFLLGAVDEEVFEAGQLVEAVEEVLVDLREWGATLMGLLERSMALRLRMVSRAGRLAILLPWRESSARFLNLERRATRGVRSRMFLPAGRST
jgi:hypothetical protein